MQVNIFSCIYSYLSPAFLLSLRLRLWVVFAGRLRKPSLMRFQDVYLAAYWFYFKGPSGSFRATFEDKIGGLWDLRQIYLIFVCKYFSNEWYHHLSHVDSSAANWILQSCYFVTRRGFYSGFAVNLNSLIDI